MISQALRIDVNSEFEVLEELLEKLPDALAPGGKVAILTFHSGEDRLVKHAFKYGKKQQPSHLQLQLVLKNATQRN